MLERQLRRYLAQRSTPERELHQYLTELSSRRFMNDVTFRTEALPAFFQNRGVKRFGPVDPFHLGAERIALVLHGAQRTGGVLRYAALHIDFISADIHDCINMGDKRRAGLYTSHTGPTVPDKIFFKCVADDFFGFIIGIFTF